MSPDELKLAAARAALDHLVPDAIVGVGTGSTVNFFIDLLADVKSRIPGAVSSSEASSARLRKHGIRVIDAAEVTSLPVYVDGADEINDGGHMIKGGGAALTREKIIADLAERFVCIADAGKRVAVLGRYPLPVEVIPMAAAQVARRFASQFGAHAAPRAGVVTDNGQSLLDVSGLSIVDPVAMEAEINQWPGVVTVGLFARRKADVGLFGTEGGVQVCRY